MQQLQKYHHVHLSIGASPWGAKYNFISLQAYSWLFNDLSHAINVLVLKLLRGPGIGMNYVIPINPRCMVVICLSVCLSVC